MESWSTRTKPFPALRRLSIGFGNGPIRFFVLTNNSIMIRSALYRIEAHSETTAMIADHIDPDIVAAIEAVLKTHLVLSGSTQQGAITTFAYHSSNVVESISDRIEAI